jgi:endonuclease YncB( thermonuclease family)
VKKQVWLVPLTLILLLSFPCLSWAWSAKVVGIADGDTITVLGDGKQQVKIRLYGIDTVMVGPNYHIEIFTLVF